ncbi:hypothetical protein BH20GEM2_BH20GEM2_15580 [soil metagenome]
MDSSTRAWKSCSRAAARSPSRNACPLRICDSAAAESSPSSAISSSLQDLGRRSSAQRAPKVSPRGVFSGQARQASSCSSLRRGTARNRLLLRTSRSTSGFPADAIWRPMNSPSGRLRRPAHGSSIPTWLCRNSRSPSTRERAATGACSARLARRVSRSKSSSGGVSRRPVERTASSRSGSSSNAVAAEVMVEWSDGRVDPAPETAPHRICRTLSATAHDRFEAAPERPHEVRRDQSLRQLCRSADPLTGRALPTRVGLAP